jgi:hypothetical protein
MRWLLKHAWIFYFHYTQRIQIRIGVQKNGKHLNNILIESENN